MEIERVLPEHTNDDTVRAIIEYGRRCSTSPAMVTLADEICGRINKQDSKSKMVAIIHWVKKHLRYVEDKDEAKRLAGYDGEAEVVKSPLAVLESGTYDCDCISTFIVSLLIIMKIPARIALVGFHYPEQTGPDGFEHVYAQGLDVATNEWVIVDPVSFPNESKMLLDTKQVQLYDIS
jgi:hypothetical protein